MDAIRIVHVGRFEPSLGREPGRAVAEELRTRFKRASDLAEADRRTLRCVFAHDLATDQLKRFGRRLQQLSGCGERFCAQFCRRSPRRFAGHHRHSRGKGAHTKGNAVGLAVHHADLPIVDAELVRADLRQHSLHALADRGRAGHDLDYAGSIDRSMHAIERSQSALFDEHGETCADGFAGGAPAFEVVTKGLPLGRRQCLVEQSGVIAGVVGHLGAKRVEMASIRHRR